MSRAWGRSHKCDVMMSEDFDVINVEHESLIFITPVEILKYLRLF